MSNTIILNDDRITFDHFKRLCNSMIEKLMIEDKMDNTVSDLYLFLQEIKDSLNRYNTILTLYNNATIYNNDTIIHFKNIEEHLINLYNIFMIECPMSGIGKGEYINFYDKLKDNNSEVFIIDEETEKKKNYKVHNLTDLEFLSLFNENISEYSFDSLITIFLSYIYDKYLFSSSK